MDLIEEKIQLIAKDIEEAGATPWTITKIVKELTKLNTRNEKKLREKTIELLKELDYSAASVYEKFSKMKVYTSKEKISSFNRGHIITSLLKETNLSRSIAEKITLEVENQIKDSKINFLTPSIIRELVNAKLINYGLEETRNKYARVGEVIWDLEQKLMNSPLVNESTREYNLLTQISPKERELHYNGTIFIEDTTGFSQRAHATTIITEKKEDSEKTIFSVFKQANKLNKYFYSPTSIYGLTHAISSEIKNDSQAKKIAKKIILVNELNEEQHPLSIELYTPKEFEKIGSNKINSAKIANHLLGENTIVGVDSKYALKLIQLKGKNFFILNNEEEQLYPLEQKLFSTTQTVLMKVGINLEKLVKKNDEDKFFEKLRELSEQIKKLKETKKNLLEKKEYLKQFDFSETKICVGITNLHALSEALDKKPIDFAGRIYKELAKNFEGELICGASPKAVKRFSEDLNKKIYPQETNIIEECLKEKKCCFTGRAATQSEVNELLTKKVKLIEYFG